jgi:quinolinate synthase
MSQIAQEIKKLQKEKDVAILAHYYLPDEVQEIADYVGDSYFLAEMATKVVEKKILLCGVYFMLESAKILNPNKTVIIPEPEADCPMAHMAKVDDILKIRGKYDDLAVVCYVNSTAEIKANSDVCVTSSNALKIVKALPNKYIYFVPDANLGKFISAQCPDKEFIYNDGYCHVHAELTADMLKDAMAKHPNAKVLVHPECKPEITQLADYAGSTSGIIKMAGEFPEEELIIGTEKGVLFELKNRYPNKKFYDAGKEQVCQDMKMITIEKVYDAIKNETNVIEMDDKLMDKAQAALSRMIELSR